MLRLEHLGQGYDAEGRLHKIEYNKLDFGSDFAFYDLTDNCVVDTSDTSLITGTFGLGVGQPGDNPRYDLNSSGYIDSADITGVNGMFGEFCPRFVYDADGNLTKLEGPKQMVYIGGVYEKNLDSGEVTKYYHTADGRRLAMRKGSTLSYFANDHLGGTAIVMNNTGGLVSRTRYYPFGQAWTQDTATTPPTDRLFTGQRRYGEKSGVYYYGARFYSADIGRFPSPHSIVPEPGNPQALNRYSYVYNNPLKFGDPSGHRPDLDNWNPRDDCYSGCGDGGGGGGGGGGPGTANDGFSDSYDTVMEGWHEAIEGQTASRGYKSVVWYSHGSNASVTFRFQTREFYYVGGAWECEAFICLPVQDPDRSGRVKLTGSLTFYRRGETHVAVSVEGIPDGPVYPAIVYMESGAQVPFLVPDGDSWNMLDDDISSAGIWIDQQEGEPTRIEVNFAAAGQGVYNWVTLDGIAVDLRNNLADSQISSPGIELPLP